MCDLHIYKTNVYFRPISMAMYAVHCKYRTQIRNVFSGKDFTVVYTIYILYYGTRE